MAKLSRMKCVELVAPEATDARAKERERRRVSASVDAHPAPQTTIAPATPVAASTGPPVATIAYRTPSPYVNPVVALVLATRAASPGVPSATAQAPLPKTPAVVVTTSASVRDQGSGALATSCARDARGHCAAVLCWPAACGPLVGATDQHRGRCGGDDFVPITWTSNVRGGDPFGWPAGHLHRPRCACYDRAQCAVDFNAS